VHLFEFDNRFSAFGGQFTFYDYNEPVRLPEEQRGHFQVVVADPPYLVRLSRKGPATLTMVWAI
jgi:hypothetical protein